MIALPKAISHGSNGAGTGALTALTAMSAARAEPESSASAVASKTIFFMTIPIAKNQSDSDGLRHSDIDCISVRNLRRGIFCGKRKRPATAAFLGVSALPGDVVAMCCIPTTFLRETRMWTDVRRSNARLQTAGERESRHWETRS